MAIKKYGPTTPGRRGMTVTDYSVLSKVAPERSLLEPMKKHSGRNNTGRITVRHQGGGNRTKYRVIDFKRQKTDKMCIRDRAGAFCVERGRKTSPSLLRNATSPNEGRPWHSTQSFRFRQRLPYQGSWRA